MTRSARSIGGRVAIAAAALALALPSQAYYHYIHFNGRNFANPLYEKFDLSALPNNTVTFFASDQSPVAYGPNDSWGSVLSQVKQALATWDAVSTSDLRVAFGGIESPNQRSGTPGGSVIFIDLPPGVIGMGGPTTAQTPVFSSGGAFFPILYSTVMLSRDTNAGAGPSYLEAFFTTAVHEIGHALGLQHTWTGSAMSQGVVRNTSRVRPLDADDRAGLSVLYGKSGWASNFGSIAGRVRFANGSDVAMASVVAVSPNGSAVSALTNPDGTYQISGLPPNLSYLVYVHPLPPDAVAGGEGLRLPVDLNGQQFSPSPNAFQTVFYRDANTTTLDPQQAQFIVANAGASSSIVNFSVQQRPSVPTYDVVTRSSLDSPSRSWVSLGGDIQTAPAFLNSTQSPALVISQALAPAVLPNPQSMTILGGFAPAPLNSPTWPAVWPRPGQPGVVDAWFAMPLGAGVGARHLVYNFGTDIYVLPNGVNLVQKGPPRIDSVITNPDGSVTIAGAGLSADSSIYFDGLKAAVVPALGFSGSDAQGSITVQPPQGASGQTATLTVYNSDGQNSMILQSQNPQTYAYPVLTSTPQISGMNYNSLPAGSSAAIDITTTGANLAGDVTVGFGSDDVTVRRVWVLGPNRLIANVAVAPNAAVGFSEVSIISGFQVISQPGGFAILPAQPGLPVVSSVANADSTQPLIYAGSTALVTGQNLTLPGTTPQVTLNDTPMQVLSASPTQIKFVVPPGFQTGVVRLNVNNGAGNAFPFEVAIDIPPATIAALTNQAGQSLLGGSVGLLDSINILVTGIDPTVMDNRSRLAVTIGGVPMPIQQITSTPNGIVIQVVVAQSFAGTQVPLMVSVDGAGSLPVMITVR